MVSDSKNYDKTQVFEFKMGAVNIITKNGQWPKSPIFSPLMLLVLKIQIGTELGLAHHRWLLELFKSWQDFSVPNLMLAVD